MIAAVTGATGYAGQFIVRRLLDEGERVRAWCRPGPAGASPDARVEWIAGSLDSPESVAPLVDGADMLVHAALDHVPGRYRGGEGADLAGFLRTNVGGTLQLLEAARRAGVSRAVVLSSRAVFGDLPGRGVVADDDRLAPDTHYGAAKGAIEAFVRSWGAEGWAIAALRPTGIYGIVEPLERTKWHGLVAAALRGQPPAPGRTGTEVHGRDVAAAVWLLLTHDAAAIAGRAFNCSDMVVSTRDVIRAAHRAAKMSGPLPDESPAPGGIMACAGLQALGMQFGGPDLFAATVADLVDRCRAG